MNDQESISWLELASIVTHAEYVERFNFCMCEEQEEFPFPDCPRVGTYTDLEIVASIVYNKGQSLSDKFEDLKEYLRLKGVSHE